MLALVCVLQAQAAPALADWEADPVAISTSSGPIPQIESCTDGAYGAFVGWIDNGVVRVQHLLPSGDLDPSWPVPGLETCQAESNAGQIDLLSDGLGGAYLWWTGSSVPGVHLLRILASGDIAPGWPTCGRFVGAGSLRVHAIGDGAHGVYVAWVEIVNGGSDAEMFVDRIGANGSAVWGGGPVHVPPDSAAGVFDWWPRLALAGDGGVYIAWDRIDVANPVAIPVQARLGHLTSTGAVPAPWPPDGLEFETFDLLQARPNASFSWPPYVDVDQDGRGGAFLLTTDLSGDSWNPLNLHVRRVQPDGANTPGWPSGGGTLTSGYADRSAPSVLWDGIDGALVGTVESGTEGSSWAPFQRWSDAGPGDAIGGIWPGTLLKQCSNGSGGLFLTSVTQYGPTSMWLGPAGVSMIQLPAPIGALDYHEIQSSPGPGHWFGAVDIAPTQDGGAILFWSQYIDRIGLFARRFNGAKQVVGVAPQEPTSGLERVWFVGGAGLHAVGVLTGGGHARLDLFDVGGRQVASHVIGGGPGRFEIRLPGSAGLASGVYFVRLRSGGLDDVARVFVLR